MGTLGIELSDAGAQAVSLDEQGGSQGLGLGEPGGRFPACALAKGEDLVLGSAAQEASYITPRSVNSLFLDDLSLKTSTLEGWSKPVAHSQLAYRFLAELERRAREEAEAIDRVALAVPGHYLEATEQAEERLGILLGILGDLELPVTGMVDMAAAALHSEGLWNVREGECLAHVDMHLHAMHVAVFIKRGGLRRVRFARLPQHGFGRMLERFTAAMANRFLKETAFDITEDRSIARAFYGQARDMLFTLTQLGEASLEVSTREKSRRMTISREIAMFDLAPQVEALTRIFQRAAREFVGSAKPTQILLSHRAAAIHGLKESIATLDMGEVRELPAESGAFGAANYVKDWEVPARIDEVRVETGIFLESQPTAPKADGLRLVSGDGRLDPTHIVCDGVAYPLEGEVFRIGVGDGGGFDLAVDGGASATDREIARLERSGGSWTLAEPEDGAGGEGGGAAVAASRPLRAGDALEAALGEETKPLLLVRCLD